MVVFFFFLFPVWEKILWRGYWKLCMPMLSLKKATKVDFVNTKQSDSVKIGFAKVLPYNLAIFLSSMLQILLLRI